MKLNKQSKLPAAVEKWLQDAGKTSAQSICHGAMYDVEWNADARPPKIPANDCAERLHERMPVAVGTTAIDTLITYAASHQSPDTFEEDLFKLRVLLQAVDDSLDAHERAADELTSEDFMHVDGGTQFMHADQSAKEPAKPPSPDTQKAFRELNTAQRLLDSLTRRRQQLRWNMFAIWWRYILDNDNKNEHRRSEYIVAIKDARLSRRKIDTVIGRLGKEVNRRKKLVTKDPEEPKAGIMQEFSVRRDPTVLVTGKGLRVRLDTQLANAQGKVLSDDFPGPRHVPKDLRPSASGLLQEFDALSVPTREKLEAKNGVFFPVYHDGKYADKDPSDENNPWRDQWNKTQPWVPLYIEWEGQYTYIPKGK
ncbi:hypothetical protein ACMFMG_004760 [Clarireedia jacksonii]